MRREKSSPYSLLHLHAFVEEGGGEDRTRARKHRECKRGEDEERIFLLLPLKHVHTRVQERRKERNKRGERDHAPLIALLFAMEKNSITRGRYAEERKERMVLLLPIKRR